MYPPSCFLRGAPNVARLWPDYPAVEEAYFKKTRLFPIMHALADYPEMRYVLGLQLSGDSLRKLNAPKIAAA